MQDGRFRKGASGNPTGKKPGTRNRATILREKLLASGAGAVEIAGMQAPIFEALVELAPTLLRTRRRQPLSLRRGYLALAFLKATTDALSATARLQQQEPADRGGDA